MAGVRLECGTGPAGFTCTDVDAQEVVLVTEQGTDTTPAKGAQGTKSGGFEMK